MTRAREPVDRRHGDMNTTAPIAAPTSSWSSSTTAVSRSWAVFGSEIETPTIDGLAQDGVRMNAFHVTALCSPSIAAARARRLSFSTSAPIPAPPQAGVVLAAGGFSRNSEFRRRHQPVGGDWTGAADGDTGDAIQAGMGVGAATALMDDAWRVAAFQYPGGGVTSCLWERSMPGSIIVDESDRRFVNESIPHVDLGHSQLARNAIPAWLIMDARHRQRYMFRTTTASVMGGTYAGPGATIGPAIVLAISPLADYSRDATDGLDRRFHKHAEFVKPLDVGPWAAFDLSFKRSPYVFLTLGGPRTSLNGEALDAHGAAVPGLCAAGACAAHLPRDGKGYASGLSLAPGSFLGRRAGRQAAGVKAAVA